MKTLVKVAVYTLGIGTIIYFLLPKILVWLIMTSDQDSPRIFKEYKIPIEHNTQIAISEMNKYGISKEEMITIIQNISDSDINNMVEQLEASGYTSRKEVTDIILSNMHTNTINSNKLRLYLNKQLSVFYVHITVNKIKKYNKLDRKLLLPIIKAIAIENIKQNRN